MSLVRRVPPAYSPISLGQIGLGVRGLFADRERLEQRAREAVKALIGTDEVIFTDSGTSALRLALEIACRPAKSPVVALPAYSCYDVATAAVGAGVKVRLYDIDARTLGPDWESLRETCAGGVDAVVIAHLFGYAVDVDAARSLCEQHGTVLIEDAAQGAMGTWRGQALGTLGDLSILSFGRGKGMSAGGGGMLRAASRYACELPEPNQVTRGKAARGWFEVVKLAAQWGFGVPGTYWLPASIPFLKLGETAYREPHVPGAAPASVLATLPLVQHRNHRGELLARITHAVQLYKLLDGCSHVSLVAGLRDSQPGYLRFPVVSRMHPRTTGSAGRLGVVRSYPQTLRSVLARVHASMLEDAGKPLTGSVELAASLWTLPTHSRLTGADVAAAADVVLNW